ncbi:MAG: hypothetical protein GX605_05360, partial [Chloroflexi bacterium]|nr:hypothetical protein [Chloroflexota bacterium]
LGAALGFDVLRRAANLGNHGASWDPLPPTSGTVAPLPPPFAVGWMEAGEPAYLFAISWTSSLLPIAVGSAVGPPTAHRCLVVPGGRSALLLRRQAWAPWLAPLLRRGRWRLVKARHLRRLAEAPEALSRARLPAILDLDPIVERSEMQMPLL